MARIRIQDWAVAAFALAMSALLTWLCCRAAGGTQGMFIGALGVATILTPPLVLALAHWGQRGAVLGAIIAGISVTWLPYLDDAPLPVTMLEWLACVMVVAGYSAALAGLGLLLGRCMNDNVAVALVVVAACLWLTWPIWMSPQLKGDAVKTVVAPLIASHPLFAIDGVLFRVMGTPWQAAPLAYQWTNLGDDISYQLPTSVFWSVTVHLLIAGACIGLDVLSSRRQRAGVAAAEVVPLA